MTNPPFTVFHYPDREPVYTENGKYYIFAPYGCVMVNNRPAVFKNWDQASQNVELDLDPDNLPLYLYAHVFAGYSGVPGYGSDEYAVEFNGSAGINGYTGANSYTAVASVCVARLGSGYNDGNQYEVCTSAINLVFPSSHPFEICWNSSDNNGRGGWIIYWPVYALYVNGNSLSPSGMTQSGRGYRWYVIPESLSLQVGDTVFCAVTITANPLQSNSVSIVKYASSAPSPQANANGDTTYYVAIAAIKKNGSSPEQKEVDQCLCSTLYLSNGRLSKQVSLLGDIRYKTSGGDHKWQVQRVVVDTNGNVTDTGVWEDVAGGEATPISGLVLTTSGV